MKRTYEKPAIDVAEARYTSPLAMSTFDLPDIDAKPAIGIDEHGDITSESSSETEYSSPWSD